jgi:hypothetical protein
VKVGSGEYGLLIFSDPDADSVDEISDEVDEEGDDLEPEDVTESEGGFDCGSSLNDQLRGYAYAEASERGLCVTAQQQQQRLVGSLGWLVATRCGRLCITSVSGWIAEPLHSHRLPSVLSLRVHICRM